MRMKTSLFFAHICVLVTFLLAISSSADEIDLPDDSHLPRCRCFPQEIIDIAQSKVKCHKRIQQRDQLYIDEPFRSVRLKAMRKLKKKMQRKLGGKASPISKAAKNQFRAAWKKAVKAKRKKKQGNTDEDDDDEDMNLKVPTVPTVSYTLTYLGDDKVHIYIDGKLVTCDTTAPKRRIQVELNNVPCTDLIVRVENESPRCKPSGGAGVAILIDYEGTTYASVPEDVEHPCQYEDHDDYCFTPAGKNIVPISGKGVIHPADNCFPYVPYSGSDENDCQVDRDDSTEKCDAAFDRSVVDIDSSLIKPKCDPKDWKLPLVAADTLSNNPLCEFVAMGRNGAIAVNPMDGIHRDDVVYGVRFDLPFCKNLS